MQAERVASGRLAKHLTADSVSVDAERHQTSLDIAASQHRQACTELATCDRLLQFYIAESASQPALTAEASELAELSLRTLSVEVNAHQLITSEVCQAEERLQVALRAVAALQERVQELSQARDAAQGEKASLDWVVADAEEAVRAKIRELEGVKKQLTSATASAAALRDELKVAREERDAALASVKDHAKRLSEQQTFAVVRSQAACRGDALEQGSRPVCTHTQLPVEDSQVCCPALSRGLSMGREVQAAEAELMTKFQAAMHEQKSLLEGVKAMHRAETAEKDNTVSELYKRAKAGEADAANATRLMERVAATYLREKHSTVRAHWLFELEDEALQEVGSLASVTTGSCESSWLRSAWPTHAAEDCSASWAAAQWFLLFSQWSVVLAVSVELQHDGRQCVQVLELTPQEGTRTLDVTDPVVPDLRFTPPLLLTLIPQLYLAKISSDVRMYDQAASKPSGAAPLPCANWFRVLSLLRA